MYRQPKKQATSIVRNESEPGELIETLVDRITSNGETPPPGAGLFSELEGTPNVAHDIRADKWQIATESMDKITTAKNSKGAKGGSKEEHTKKDSPIDNKEGGDTATSEQPKN